MKMKLMSSNEDDENENDKTLMSSNDDDGNENGNKDVDDDDDETMNQNKKNIIIKNLNDCLDEIIHKSKTFEEQMKSLTKPRRV